MVSIFESVFISETPVVLFTLGIVVPSFFAFSGVVFSGEQLKSRSCPHFISFSSSTSVSTSNTELSNASLFSSNSVDESALSFPSATKISRKNNTKL